MLSNDLLGGKAFLCCQLCSCGKTDLLSVQLGGCQTFFRTLVQVSDFLFRLIESKPDLFLAVQGRLW